MSALSSELIAMDHEDRRQHLQFVEAVIARMSSSSALAKGWALTIATATYGYAGTKNSAIVALLGIAAVVMFALLDARYLLQERRYRKLFDGVRADQVELYDMNAAAYCKNLDNSDQTDISWPSVFRSWSIREYYGIIALAGVLLLVWLNLQLMSFVGVVLLLLLHHLV